MLKKVSFVDMTTLKKPKNGAIKPNPIIDGEQE